MSWAAAFALTLAVELPLAALCAPRGARRPCLGVALAANAVTHPLAWLASGGLDADWWLVEVAVTAVELALYRAAAGLTWRRAALVAGAANGATALLAQLF